MPILPSNPKAKLRESLRHFAIDQPRGGNRRDWRRFAKSRMSPISPRRHCRSGDRSRGSLIRHRRTRARHGGPGGLTGYPAFSLYPPFATKDARRICPIESSHPATYVPDAFRRYVAVWRGIAEGCEAPERIAPVLLFWTLVPKGPRCESSRFSCASSSSVGRFGC